MEQTETHIDKSAVEDEFSAKLGRAAHSAAYLDFCEQVYGYRTCLFNMMDREQLKYVMDCIPISREDTLVEPGCGTGGILGRLTAKYGCAGTGVDLIDARLLEASDGMRYIRGDIDSVAYDELKPTVTLAVDSLYFSADLNKLISGLTNIKGNRLYLFYSQYLFGEATADKSALLSGSTALAKALTLAGAAFKALDFSENERLLYADSQKALLKSRRAFELENNIELYEQKLAEVRMGVELFDKGLASRYLYIVDA